MAAVHSQGHHNDAAAWHRQGTARVMPGFEPATQPVIVPRILEMLITVASLIDVMFY